MEYIACRGVFAENRPRAIFLQILRGRTIYKPYYIGYILRVYFSPMEAAIFKRCGLLLRMLSNRVHLLLSSSA